MAEVVCLQCRKVFHRPPSHIKERVFCGVSCRKDYFRQELLCPGCGATFHRDPRQPNRVYCTWECYKASRHQTVYCTVCQQPFDSYLSEVRKRSDRGHFPCCSRSCRNTLTSLLLGGNGYWVEGGKYEASRGRGYDWRVVRGKYLASVKYLCEGCEGALAVEVHHLHPVAGGGDLYAFDNLMAVCKDCHKIMHEQLRGGAMWGSFEGFQYDCNI